MALTQPLLFPLGQVVATRNAYDALTALDIRNAISRHVSGDWGEIDEADRKENEFSLEHSCRLLSAYDSESGIRFWIITEADRNSTTVLLPEDY